MCYTMLNKMHLLMVVTVAVALIGAPATGQTWNYTNDYSETGNPAGAWSYGRLDALSVFALDTLSVYDGTLHIWCDPATGNPSPAINLGDAIDYAAISTYFPAGEGWMCSPGNEYKADVRWTAPSDGLVSISAVFKGLDYANGAYSDAGVMLDGETLFSGQVRGYYGGGDHAAFGAMPVVTYSSELIEVTAGQTIDFFLGNPGDRTTYDRVGFDATVTLIPEPSSLLALTGGFGCLVAIVRRRRS